MFREVKNVNVESLKNGSKLLDFWGGSLPQPLPKGKGFSNFDMRLYMRVYMTPPRGSALDAVVYGLCTASCIVLRTLVV